jgi:hypothetical protein
MLGVLPATSSLDAHRYTLRGKPPLIRRQLKAAPRSYFTASLLASARFEGHIACLLEFGLPVSSDYPNTRAMPLRLVGWHLFTGDQFIMSRHATGVGSEATAAEITTYWTCATGVNEFAATCLLLDGQLTSTAH